MSTSKTSAAFLERLISDEAYQQSFGKSPTSEAIIAKGKADGYDINPVDLEAAAREQLDPRFLQGDLTEEELEQTVGGVIPIVAYGVGLACVTVAGFTAGVITRGVEELLKD